MKLSSLIMLVFMIMLIALLILPTSAEARRLNYESFYVDDTCKGIIEYTNSDNTRTDCYTKSFSMEYDFAQKWAECIGQSLHYGRINNNQPICVLIIEKQTDCKYINRAIPFIYTILVGKPEYCTKNVFGKYGFPDKE